MNVMPSRMQLDSKLDDHFQERPHPRLDDPPAQGEKVGRRRSPDLCEIRLARIRPAKDQVRKVNKGPDNPRTRELAESIRSQGVLQPITVRYVAKGDYFEIVAGERRYWGATLAKLDVVPCVVKNYDEDAAARAQLSENIHRENLTSVEIGLALKKRLNKGDSVRDLVQFTNKGKSWISRHLSIATKLTAAAIEEAGSSEKPMTTFDTLYEVSQLPDDQQVPMIARIRKQGLSIAQVKTEAAPLKNKVSGRPKGRRNYRTVVSVDGAVVTVKFRKSRASSQEVLAKLDEAIGKLKAATRSKAA